MPYEVRLHRSASAYLSRLDRRTQERMRDRLRMLASDPFDARYSKPLAGDPGRRSARIGGWRIIFTTEAESEIVLVSRIGPRGQVYRERRDGEGGIRTHETLLPTRSPGVPDRPLQHLSSEPSAISIQLSATWSGGSLLKADG